MNVVMAMDTKVDTDGIEHPWRLVAIDVDRPRRRHQWIGSIPDVGYVVQPRDAMYGDLTRQGTPLIERCPEIIEGIVEIGGGPVHVEEHHEGMDLVAALSAYGVDVVTIPVAGAVDTELDDAYSLGGWAGHAVTCMARDIRGIA